MYREAELYKAAVRLYTKPIFCWRKALFASTDGRDLYDFARAGLRNLEGIHGALQRETFSFRPAVALRREFRGKRRVLYVYPWEERLVDLLLYRLLSGRLQNWFSANSYAYRLRGFGLDRCQRKIARVLRETRGPLFAVKRDVANYFPSVDHALLREQLAELIEPGDYLFRLMEERMRFTYEEEEGALEYGEEEGTPEEKSKPAPSKAKGAAPRRAERGIALGTAMAAMFANVYLTKLDRRLDAIGGLHYFRYADDLLLVAEERAAIERAKEEFAEGMTELRLESKGSCEGDWILVQNRASLVPVYGKGVEVEEGSFATLRMTKQEGAAVAVAAGAVESKPGFFAPPAGAGGLRMTAQEATAGFVVTRKIRHLGLEFCADGMVRLSRDKCRKVENVFRFAFRKKRAKLGRIREPRKRAEFLVSVAGHALKQSVRKVAIVDYYLKHVNDEAQLRLMDRWLAEEVLALTFGGHSKGNFRRIPFAALRAMGLPSLVHRRRQIRHGQIAAPFFVWKNYQAEKSSRETAVKLRQVSKNAGRDAGGTQRKAEAAAFSPSPEAVT